jgi:hypothetical protein
MIIILTFCRRLYTMNSFRLTIVKNTMLIYVHSFRLCQPLLSVGSQQLFFSWTGFVYVKNWKNSENSSISQLCFLFLIYLRFIITLIKIFCMWMFCITLKERNTKRFVQNWHSPSHLRQNGHVYYLKTKINPKQ